MTTAQAQAPTDFGQLFVDLFAQTCVPQRLSFDGTKSHAVLQGWETVETSVHPELDRMLSVTANLLADPNLPISYDYSSYRQTLAGRDLYLVVIRSASQPAPELGELVDIGCYLYDFDAVEPIDPAPVTALLEVPIAQSFDDANGVGHVWGPPPALPGTLDTFLGFIREGSQAESEGGFSGLALRMSTTEPSGLVPVPDANAPAAPGRA